MSAQPTVKLAPGQSCCAWESNRPDGCWISWKCHPWDGQAGCVWHCAPCPVCGGRAGIHYRREHEMADAGVPLPIPRPWERL